MITLGLAKARLINFAPDTDTLVFRLNAAVEELLNRLSHKGSQRRAVFTVTGGTFTLPWQFSGVLGVSLGCGAIRILNQWWEMLPQGPGPQDEVCGVAIDAGDGWVVFKDLADVDEDGCYLKVISDVAEETDPEILFKGLDEDGEELRTQDSDGAYINGEKALVTSAAVWTTNKFTTLDQVIKDATSGRVRVYADPVSGAASPTLVAIYQPDETHPCWRRYRLPVTSDSDGTATATTVTALCQVRHQWVTNDDAVLPIGNLGALRDALMALQAKDQNDGDRHDQLMQDAVDKLNREHKRYHPDGGYVTPVQIFGDYPVENMM